MVYTVSERPDPMNICEVRINVDGDNMAHISRLNPLRYRVQEDIVRLYYGRPQEECEVRGTKRGVASRVCTMYADSADKVTMLKRTPLQACMVEWLADMQTLLSRRLTYMVTHCVQVHIDAFEDGSTKTTVVWALSGQDAHQRARVDDLLQRLMPGCDGTVTELLDKLQRDPVWKDR